MLVKCAAADPKITGDARREQGYLKTFFRAVDSVTTAAPSKDDTV
jgi:hypothetical protein